MNTTKMTPETMSKIMNADILTKHPAPKTPSLYFDKVQIQMNPATRAFEARLMHGPDHVATIGIGDYFDPARGDVLVLNGIQGYMPVNMTA
jgi:hypothetical protein